MKVHAIIPFTVIVMVVLTSQPLKAQENFEDLMKKSRKEFEELKKEADEEFEELKKSIDEEFAEILERAWKELELNTGKKRDTTPKPVIAPVARPKQVPKKEPEKIPDKKPPVEVPEKIPEAKVPEKKPAPKPPEKKPPVRKVEKEKPAPQLPRREQKVVQPKVPVEETLSLVFFDTPITVACDRGLKINIGSIISEKTISSFWTTISKQKYLPCLKQAYTFKEQFRLNDWGYCILLDTIAQGIYGRSTNNRNLFVWFMLVKSGYDARVGFNENQVLLLLPSVNTLYSVPYYELSNVTYYITFLGTTPQSVKSLYTYEGKHKGSDKQIDMNIYSQPDINRKVQQKEYTFSYFDKEYRVPVNVNSNLADYYEFYPQTNLNVYFDAPISVETGNALLEGLKPLIRNKPEDEAVNILLRFVQTAFDYKTDDDQFKREKHLFVEETLYYPFSDCEDRSFLFAFLVNNLLGLEVIGLHYPGHVATAVKFTGNVRGDNLRYNNNTYIICDPTYINANYGECMPKFKNVSPKIVQINMH